MPQLPTPPAAVPGPTPPSVNFGQPPQSPPPQQTVMQHLPNQNVPHRVPYITPPAPAPQPAAAPPPAAPQAPAPLPQQQAAAPHAPGAGNGNFDRFLKFNQDPPQFPRKKLEPKADPKAKTKIIEKTITETVKETSVVTKLDPVVLSEKDLRTAKDQIDRIVGGSLKVEDLQPDQRRKLAAALTMGKEMDKVTITKFYKVADVTSTAAERAKRDSHRLDDEMSTDSKAAGAAAVLTLIGGAQVAAAAAQVSGVPGVAQVGTMFNAGLGIGKAVSAASASGSNPSKTIGAGASGMEDAHELGGTLGQVQSGGGALPHSTAAVGVGAVGDAFSAHEKFTAATDKAERGDVIGADLDRIGGTVQAGRAVAGVGALAGNAAAGRALPGLSAAVDGAEGLSTAHEGLRGGAEALDNAQARIRNSQILLNNAARLEQQSQVNRDKADLGTLAQGDIGSTVLRQIEQLDPSIKRETSVERSTSTTVTSPRP